MTGSEDQDWLGGFDTDRTQDAAKALRLVNLLAQLEGSRAHKLKWLEKQMPLLEAEASKAGHEPGTRAFGAAIVSVTIRFYRYYVNKLHANGKRVPQEGGEVVQLVKRERA